MGREIHKRDELESYLAEGHDLRNVVVQNLELTAMAPIIERVAVDGAVFLGCTLADSTLAYAQRGGGLVFPMLSGLPFNPYRAHLYTAGELFEGFDKGVPDSYGRTLDARVYDHWKQTGGSAPPRISESLARRLHDHAVSDALGDFLHAATTPDRVVAIMGGHGMLRTEPAYREIVLMARELTRRGYLCASGGGPGAMEATHLGAHLAGHDDDVLERALALLAEAPHYRDRRWLAQAFEVLDLLPAAAGDGSLSLAIPTWHYGHEPPNPFASHIAKYFENSVREEGLVTIARHGIIFAPGSAGTVQEIFQDACQNHYATTGEVSPMIFLGTDVWTKDKPVMPLLDALAGDRPYRRLIAAVNGANDAVSFLVAHPPEKV